MLRVNDGHKVYASVVKKNVDFIIKFLRQNKLEIKEICDIKVYLYVKEGVHFYQIHVAVISKTVLFQ